MTDALAIWKAWSNSKILPPERIEETVLSLRKAGKKIVTINGSFDLLHAGHLFILFDAKAQGDILIVALNTDSSVRAYKSPDRPIIPLAERIEMMTGIEFVDYVTWFDETDPRAILSKIRPDIHANGAEYGENCIEADVVKQMGGKIHLIPRIPGLATSDIIKKIQSLKSY